MPNSAQLISSKGATPKSSTKSKIPAWVKQPKQLTAAAAAEVALAGAFDDVDESFDGAAALSAALDADDALGTTCNSIATLQKLTASHVAANNAKASAHRSPLLTIVHGPSLDSMFCNDSRSPSLASEVSCNRHVTVMYPSCNRRSRPRWVACLMCRCCGGGECCSP